MAKVVSSKVYIQKVWNWFSVPIITLLMWHALSSGPLTVPVPVIDRAVAEQAEQTEESSKSVSSEHLESEDMLTDSVLARSHKDLSEVDVMHLAVSLGRLDFISLGLTILGVALAVLGLFGFWKIERDTKLVAEEVAEREAKKTSRSEAQRLAKVYLNSDELQNKIEERIDTEVRNIAPEIIETWLRKTTKYTSNTSSAHGSGYIPTDEDNKESSKGGEK